MKIAVISDIHSNIFALEAVLADIRSRQADKIVNLGDTLLGPIDPLQTANCLMSMDNVVNIMGNGDEMLLQDNGSSPSYKFVKPLLNSEILAWIRTFQRQWIWESLLFCHASPNSNVTYLIEEVGSAGIQNKPLDKLKTELKNICQNYVVCGHSHLGKTVYLSEDKMIVNAGSVGLPAYYDEEPLPHAVETFSPHAKYLMITLQDHRIISVEHIALCYDWEKASNRAKANEREDYAFALLTGRALKID